MKNLGQRGRSQSELRGKGLEGSKAEMGSLAGKKSKRRHPEHNKV